jgi:hypothetical protein
LSQWLGLIVAHLKGQSDISQLDLTISAVARLRRPKEPNKEQPIHYLLCHKYIIRQIFCQGFWAIFGVIKKGLIFETNQGPTSKHTA